MALYHRNKWVKFDFWPNSNRLFFSFFRSSLTLNVHTHARYHNLVANRCLGTAVRDSRKGQPSEKTVRSKGLMKLV